MRIIRIWSAENDNNPHALLDNIERAIALTGPGEFEIAISDVHYLLVRRDLPPIGSFDDNFVWDVDSDGAGEGSTAFDALYLVMRNLHDSCTTATVYRTGPLIGG